MIPSFSYARPTTVREAVRLLARPGARAHAGGTDLLGCLRDGVFTAKTVVSLSGLDTLRGVTPRPDGGLRIGALATLAEIAAHAGIGTRYAALAQGAAAAASPQLRNQGTLGGNLCQRPRCFYFRGDFPCLRKGGDTCFAVAGANELHAVFGGSSCFFVHPSDCASPLAALGATVVVSGPAGVRTLPIESFFVAPEQSLTRENSLAPGELVTEVRLPKPAGGLRSSYRKVRARGSWDFAVAGVALAVERHEGQVTSARVVLSGVAPVPWRARAAEAALLGAQLDATSAARAGEAAAEGAEPMEQNAYKVTIVRRIVTEGLLALA